MINLINSMLLDIRTYLYTSLDYIIHINSINFQDFACSTPPPPIGFNEVREGVKNIEEKYQFPESCCNLEFCHPAFLCFLEMLKLQAPQHLTLRKRLTTPCEDCQSFTSKVIDSIADVLSLSSLTIHTYIYE
jgi:hypothetical protein